MPEQSPIDRFPDQDLVHLSASEKAQLVSFQQTRLPEFFAKLDVLNARYVHLWQSNHEKNFLPPDFSVWIARISQDIVSLSESFSGFFTKETISVVDPKTQKKERKEVAVSLKEVARDFNAYHREKFQRFQYKDWKDLQKSFMKKMKYWSGQQETLKQSATHALERLTSLLQDFERLEQLANLHFFIHDIRQRVEQEGEQVESELKDLLAELRILLKRIDVTENGIDPEDEGHFRHAQELYKQIRDFGNRDRKRREARADLEMIKVQIGRECQDFATMVNTYVRLRSVEKIAGDDRQQLESGIADLLAAAKKASDRLDDLMADNHVLDLDVHIVRQELLADVLSKKNDLEELVKRLFSSFSSQNALPPPSPSVRELPPAQVSLASSTEVTEATGVTEAAVDIDRADYDPFDSKELLNENMNLWITGQYQKRSETLNYFGMSSLKCIDQKKYEPPSAQDIVAGMTPEKMQLINTFKKPLLVMTPIGVSLKDLAAALGSKKGACAIHNPPHFWFDHEADLTGNMVYGVKNFDKINHQGKTKKELLADRTLQRFKGWQVLVVEGVEELSKKGKTAHHILEEYRKKGFTGLAPEDSLMLQAEGVRQGKPFEQGSDWTWLTGAYLKSLGKVPYSRWSSGDSRVDLNYGGPGSSIPDLGSRPAVRIL